MEAIFESERIVAESRLCHASNGLSLQRVGVPTNLKIAGCGELEQTREIVFAFLLEAHYMIVPVFDFQHAVLGNVRRVGHRRPVRIRHNAVLRGIGTLCSSVQWRNATDRECRDGRANPFAWFHSHEGSETSVNRATL